ncbi:MAG: urea ABC transporter permease subunit UrtB [Rhodocyclaceae bacterium]|nr:urea ABC transporter permease subunit UrtB [Rhodocyclaceae bacterium]MDZ4216604.1 urea ABC transporter permease subunit UrtB [Rhodocyclaceae bacterium]
MSRFFIAFFCWLTFSAHASIDPALVKQLAAEESDDKIAAILKIAETAEPEALTILQSLADGTLIAPDGSEIMLNNRIRGVLANAIAGLRLFDGDAKVRRAAAQELQTNVSLEMAPLLGKAIAQEGNDKIKALLVAAYAQANLSSPDVAQRLAAVQVLGEYASRNTRSLLLPLAKEEGEADAAVRAAAIQSLKVVESRLAVGETLGRVFSGLSLGSILLLAALGLAITYGVMGVINMAHGELLMVGAYATYLVQSLFRSHFPAWIDAYVLAALPVAFFAAAAVGIVLERTVIRRLYGRPLETLLATWGLSLILIQAARVLFGAQNVELANPEWMSGGVELMAGLVLPWNRIAIIGFSLFVLLLVWLLMNKTRLGMFVRAVTQNRPMAGCVGVHTAKIDTLAFGLGAGIAGLGGVALSQIANVGPDMGQGYIVDSFMVVVLGGVGQLAGAVWAALGLGVFTKFLEGWAGAVIAKIVVLVFIIIFIQKRPQGLFALKGRFVES